MEKTSLITSCRITALPQSWMDPMPKVFVKIDDEDEQFLFSYYPDEISFSSSEFIGLTIDEAHNLKFKKDKNYLQS